MIIASVHNDLAVASSGSKDVTAKVMRVNALVLLDGIAMGQQVLRYSVTLSSSDPGHCILILALDVQLPLYGRLT